jgi:hypothetical protein
MIWRNKSGVLYDGCLSVAETGDKLMGYCFNEQTLPAAIAFKVSGIRENNSVVGASFEKKSVVVLSEFFPDRIVELASCEFAPEGRVSLTGSNIAVDGYDRREPLRYAPINLGEHGA